MRTDLESVALNSNTCNDNTTALMADRQGPRLNWRLLLFLITFFHMSSSNSGPMGEVWDRECKEGSCRIFMLLSVLNPRGCTYPFPHLPCLHPSSSWKQTDKEPMLVMLSFLRTTPLLAHDSGSIHIVYVQTILLYGRISSDANCDGNKISCSYTVVSEVAFIINELHICLVEQIYGSAFKDPNHSLSSVALPRC